MTLALPPDHWAGIIERATVYRARVGSRPYFQSEADALAFEYGYTHPYEPHHAYSPASVGAFEKAEEDDPLPVGMRCEFNWDADRKHLSFRENEMEQREEARIDEQEPIE